MDRRLVLRTTAAATCSTGEHDSQANCPTGERSGLQTHIVTGSYFMRADEKLTAFVELERVIHQFAVSLLS